MEILPRQQIKTLDIKGGAVTLWDSQKSQIRSTLQDLMCGGHTTDGKQLSCPCSHNAIYLLDDLMMSLLGWDQ